MAHSLRAGTALTNISPKPGIVLAGVPHCPRPNKGIHDPLYTACLTLDDGSTQLAIICMDMLFFPKSEVKKVRKGVSENTGIPASNILISCSHTHSGPSTDSQLFLEALDAGWEVDKSYMAELHDKLVNLVVDAWNNPFDASIGIDKGFCGREQGVGGNRHNPNDIADPEVWTIGVKDSSGSLRSCLVKYALHPTFLHADNFLVSADYPGALRAYLNEKHPDTVILFAQGTSGNQSGRYFRSGKTFKEAQRVGEAIAAEANRVLRTLEYTSDVKLLCTSTEVDIDLRELPPLDIAQAAVDRAKQDWESLKDSRKNKLDIWNKELLLMGAECTLALAEMEKRFGKEKLAGKDLPAEIQVLGINDARVVGLQGEIFVEFGLTIQYKAPFDKCFVIELANGSLPGYACTTRDYIQNGYENGASLMTGHSGEQLVESAVKLLKQTAIE